MIYKDLQAKHVPQLVKLYVEAFNAPPWNDEWTLESASNRLLQMINCEGFYGLICCENNEIRGMILGNHEYYYNGMHFNIKEFCIDVRLQGSGVGSALFDEFLLRLKNRGIDKAFLYTSRTPKTEGYYKNRGFESYNDMVMMCKELKCIDNK